MNKLPEHTNNPKAMAFAEQLKKDGFQQFQSSFYNDEKYAGVINTHWQKRMDLNRDDIPLCQCNDKILINIHIRSGSETIGSQTVSFNDSDIELTAETEDSDWIDFKYYGLSFNDAQERYAILIERLLLAWCAVAG